MSSYPPVLSNAAVSFPAQGLGIVFLPIRVPTNAQVHCPFGAEEDSACVRSPLLPDCGCGENSCFGVLLPRLPHWGDYILSSFSCFCYLSQKQERNEGSHQHDLDTLFSLACGPSLGY